MQILDDDMQMVRDFLKEANAPEYVKGHFENLVDEHAKEAARVEELHGELSDAADELKLELARKQEDADLIEDDLRQALETVKYAFLDTMVHGRPMMRPKDLLRIVEDALG